VLRIGGACWGYICLHRAPGAPFSKAEARYVARLAPYVAEAIRAGLLQASVELADVPDGPGLVVIAADGSPAAITEAGERWLDELGHASADRHALPGEIHALAARVQRSDDGLPRVRVRTRTGRWAVLHASKLPTAGAPAVAIIIEEPAPAELAPLLMLAYGLTPQERAVTRLVCRGLSTPELAEQLHITPNTLQDHLKSIFEKTGVSSRRELVAAILQEQYLPRALAGRPVGASGFFVA
jgi:DNA-binding CsgD family transcriptional regulator